MRVVKDSVELLDPVLAYLPHLVPKAAVVQADAPPAAEERFLDPLARPCNPGDAAIVAVIDYAIPFAHPLFTASGGKSRFAAIWVMEAAATEQRPDIAFGRELRGVQIDALHVPGDPDAAYRSCGLMSPDGCMSMAHASSHGAAVAALAAGYLPSDKEGRRFPLLGVSLPRSVIAETSGSLSALFIQAAVTFVIARARALAREMSKDGEQAITPPLVVNLSLGVTAGAEDGSGLLTRLQDAICKGGIDGLGRIHFVVPTGNHRQDCLRARLSQGDSIGWNIPPADPTPNALEIWAAAKEEVPQLAVETPSGMRFDIPLSSSGAFTLLDSKMKPIGRAVLQRRGELRDRFCLTVILPPTLPKKQDDPCAPPGLWRLHIVAAGVNGCDLVIHRDDRLPGMRRQARQSRLVEEGYSRRTDDGRWPFEDPDDVGAIRRNGTISTYARGNSQVRVGAHYARCPSKISPYSGLMANGAAGDITAPADASPLQTGMILPAITQAGRQRLSGTSLSAPQVTRWLAASLANGTDIPDRDALPAAMKGTKTSTLTRPYEEGTALALSVPELPWRHGFPD